MLEKIKAIIVKFFLKVKDLFLYLIVGVGATIVEWVIFYLLDKCTSINYMISTGIAFVFSTFANWALGRIIMFHKSNQSILAEIGKIYLTSISGFLMNLLIMYIAIDKFAVSNMVSKMIATAIVFFWNFLVRKFLIYR